MFDKYTKGMEEIKADDELKDNMVKKLKEKDYKKPYYNLPFKKIIALTCTFALIIMVGLTSMTGNKLIPWGRGSGINDSFSGFVITAYASDGSPIEIKPNVEFIIGKYQMTMSSVPGFPLKIMCPDADAIKISVTDGEFILWNQSDYKIKNQGREIEIKSGDTIYWSPLNQNSNGKVADTASVNIKAYKGKKELGSSLVKMKMDSNFTYTGTLVK